MNDALTQSTTCRGNNEDKPSALRHWASKLRGSSSSRSTSTSPYDEAGPIPRAPVSHQTRQALEQGTLAYSFSGGGFHVCYHAGVVHTLQHLNLLMPGQTHLAGSSAGAIIAASVTCGIDTQKVLGSALAVAANCRVHGAPRRLAGLLMQELVEHVPPDAHLRCQQRAHLGVTKLWPWPKSKVVSNFGSWQDLVDTVLASCHIPALSDGKLTRQWRGRSVIDGGITNLLPMPCPEARCTRVVKVSCFPRALIPQLPVLNTKQAVEDLAIAPDLFEPWPHDAQQTFEWALHPGPHAFMMDLVTRGMRDAHRWAASMGLTHKQLSDIPPLSAPEDDPAEAAKAGGSQARDEERRSRGAVGGGDGEAAVEGSLTSSMASTSPLAAPLPEPLKAALVASAGGSSSRAGQPAAASSARAAADRTTRGMIAP